MSRNHPIVTVLTARGEEQPPGLEPLTSEAEVRWASSESELRRALPSSDVLLVTDFRSDALEAAWEAADSLQWMHATSAGVDAVLFPASVAADVVVTNAQGVFDRTIAEYVLGVVLAFAKDTRRNIELQAERRWLHRETERVEGTRMLVVGAGSIGGTVAELCRAVGMRVEGTARSAREDARFDAVHAADRLHELLPAADWVVITAPLTAATEGLFDAEALARMKPGARLINVGRGAIVNTDDLVDALRRGGIAGAALDVFEQEPLPPEHPLWELDSVLISAHMAGDFVGWREALSAQFLDNFDRWRRGEPLLNVVDKQRATAGRTPEDSTANVSERTSP